MHFHFNPRLLHLAGPIFINAFGVFIALGVALFLWGILRDCRRKALVNHTIFLELLSSSVIWGIIFARLLYSIENIEYFTQNPLKLFAIWNGGFSLLGTLVGVPIILFYKLKHYKISPTPFFDLILTYVPAVQAISRIGCFCAGCCHGCTAASNAFFSITYTHPNSLAILNTPVYPTQLYSAAASLCIFIFLFIISKLKTPTGLITSLFFLLEGFSRFYIDFWRGDRSDLILFNISWYQLLALIISLSGFVGILYITLRKKNIYIMR